MTYIERTRSAVEALENALRTYFKADGAPPIPFPYNGATYDIRDRETRMLLVAAIQDGYYREHGEFNQRVLDAWYERGAKGERPSPVKVDSALMDRLTNAVLYEELTDTRPDKMTIEEYPIMSLYQEDRRRDNEYSDVLAETYGADGNDRAKPIRRVRTAREHRFVEKTAQEKNRERKAQYKRDSSPGRMKSYNLRENGGELTEPFTERIGLGRRWAEGMCAMNEVTLEQAEEVPLTLPEAA
ncbi:hypothetical protein [Paenibacillus sp. SN-8-1]|uniref:hypothetical protein n=1 Tax=Paenibacillus sp. SN-8-1 TaxID=3435409 RepID=UPI003D9A499C